MIGYKATRNGYCLNKFYEVGKTYTFYGELVMCLNGFHFCQDLINVFFYYPSNKYTKVFKVEAVGNVETENDKSVTDKIRILEEVNLSNLILEKYGHKRYFDDKGNCIKVECPDGNWEKWECDENNNCIKYENSYGFWVKHEYNSKNNIIKSEDSTGYWAKYEYDLNNNRIKKEYGSRSTFL